jgi:acetyl esterase
MPVNSQAQEVLDTYATLGPLPIETLTPEQARQLPTLADAVQGLIGQHLTTRAVTPVPEPVAAVAHPLIPGQGGELLARIYTPKGDGPFPVLLYFHGGGWVIANLDTYDSSCRALCNAAECVVV